MLGQHCDQPRSLFNWLVLAPSSDQVTDLPAFTNADYTSASHRIESHICIAWSRFMATIHLCVVYTRQLVGRVKIVPR